jgi:hypothetical protein
MLAISRSQWFERGMIVASAIALICACSLDFARMRASLPYPQHIDEQPVLAAAAQILQSGDWNPHLYSYPSLPIYLATVGLGLGVVSASSQGPDRVTTNKIGRLYGGYYEQPLVAAVPRELWMLMGALTLMAAALLAFYNGGAAGLLLATPMLLLGTTVRGLATNYINVDTAMCLWMALCLLQLVSSESSQRARDKILIPGILCGAAIASKYTAVVLLAPCLLNVCLWSERDRVLRSIALALTALAAFVLFCPYFVLDPSHFVDGLAAEAYHYGVAGHRRFDVEPGLGQLIAYAHNVLDEYGMGIAVLALLGMVGLAVDRPRRAAVLIALPLASLVLLCRYKVHFARNALPFQMIAPVFAAAGGLFAHRLLCAALTRWVGPRAHWAAPLHLQLLAAGLILIAVLPSLPFGRARGSYERNSDSRNLFVAWAKKRLPKGSNVVLINNMPVAPRTLQPELNPLVVDLRDVDDVRRFAIPGNYMLLAHWNPRPGWAAQRLALVSPGLQALPAHEVVKSFDGRPVIPIKKDRESCFNPGFDLVRFTDRP